MADKIFCLIGKLLYRILDYYSFGIKFIILFSQIKQIIWGKIKSLIYDLIYIF